MNIDPNIAALLGAGGGNDQFTQMLLRSINPDVAGKLEGNVGAPDVNPLMNLAGAAPAIKTADPQPALAGPQMLQSLGFGMAAAAGKPGATGLSALGEGGKDVLSGGAAASQRAIQEAQAENSAAISEWEGKGRIADRVLDAQMKEPDLDMRMMDLTGQSLARDASRQDSAAYRAGLLENSAAKTGVAQQNADTAGRRAATGEDRAATYADRTAADATAKTKANELRAAALDQSASQFQQKLLADARARGDRLGLSTAQAAAQEFKNEMQLRKNPITGELPDDSVQEALRESLAAKYSRASSKGGGSAPNPDEALAQAKAALAKGADPAAVRKRLSEMGVDPRGLEL